MVIAIVEPVCVGIMVALINNYLLNNLGVVWQSCSAEELVVDAHELEKEEGEALSSTNTTISDVDIHVHCHG
jgi:predicted membrane GTPase involved in stress response